MGDGLAALASLVRRLARELIAPPRSFPVFSLVEVCHD